MIPEFDVELSPEIPDGATFWVPEEEDLDEEGIGFFRGTWLIHNVTASEATDMLQTELTLLQLIDNISETDEEYEENAGLIDLWDLETLPDIIRNDPIFESLPFQTEEDGAPLCGLDLGVAGLVFALAAAGFVTAASCRGHTGDRAWAEYPVVLFATDVEHMQVLQLLARNVGCGFAIDPARPSLMCVLGRSVRCMVKLAELIVSRLADFGEMNTIERQAASADKPVEPVDCQRPSCGPRWWPTKSPHPSGLISVSCGWCLPSLGPHACGRTRRQ